MDNLLLMQWQSANISHSVSQGAVSSGTKTCVINHLIDKQLFKFLKTNILLVAQDNQQLTVNLSQFRL